MNLTDQQKQWLHEALSALANGSSKRYHDVMWLGFGDLWSELESRLTRGGAIRVRGRHGEDVSLTDAGQQLLRELGACFGRGPDASDDEPAFEAFAAVA